jgi:hypothetical protein
LAPVAIIWDHLTPTATCVPAASEASAVASRFRLRSFHVEDLEHYGVGCVLTLD